MRSRRPVLRVPAALTPVVRRTLLALLAAALIVPAIPAEPAGAVTAMPGAGASRVYEPPSAPLGAPPGTTSLISVARKGGAGNSASLMPAASANGRYVAFASVASDLVGGDVNGATEIFVRDRQTGTTTRVLTMTGVVPPGGRAIEPAISADGSVIAYTYQPPPGLEGTAAETIVLGWDRVQGVAFLVSRLPKSTQAMSGSHAPTVAADGRFIAYASTYDAFSEDESADDVFLFDRQTGRTVQVSTGIKGQRVPEPSTDPSISGDGTLVAFSSDGGARLTGQNPGQGRQVFVRDMTTTTITQVSASLPGSEPDGVSGEPAISQDGRFVAFTSQASTLVPGVGGGSQVYRRDLATGVTEAVSLDINGVTSDGFSGQPSISADGGMVAFVSNAPGLTALGRSGIVLAASAKLPTDVFLRDMDTAETVLISVTTEGTTTASGFRQSFEPVVAAAGRFVFFASESEFLVANDGNESFDVFLRDLPPIPALNPPVLDMGARAVGMASLPAAAVLSNTGWGPLVVKASTITGVNAADFPLVADGCVGQTLKRNQACTVSVVFQPSEKGARSATLGVPVAGRKAPLTVALRGIASKARLDLEPPVGPPGTVVVVEGSGFPPNTPVRLTWSLGITPHLPDVMTDATGAFHVQVLVFHHDVVGPRDLQADPVDGQAFPPVAQTMLVVRPSAVPPRFDILRFIDTPLVLVFRG